MHVPDYAAGRLLSGQRLSLEPLRAVLERLGHPERVVPTVLVGGTNGKGSTQAFLASILAAAGLRVGTFTSPSLEDFHELIRIEGRNIDPEFARPLAEIALEAAGPSGLTLFELATVVAWLAFGRTRPDIAVIEVGMGGARDATNTCEPILSILTQVAMDHRAELGDTLEAIAREKAGIVRSGRTLITGADGAALKVLRETCHRLGSRIDVLGSDFRLVPGSPGLRFERGSGRGAGTIDFRDPDFRVVPGSAGLQSERGDHAPGVPMAFQQERKESGPRLWNSLSGIDNLELGLAGPHQWKNAALAVQAALRLAEAGFAVPEAAIRRGLRETYLPGRLEWMTARDGRRILVDGAHNPHGAEALAVGLEALGLSRPRRLVMAAYADKDVEGMVAALLPAVDTLVCTRTSSPRCLSPAALERRARAVVPSGFDLRVAADMAGALALLWAAEPAGTLVVSGSLSVVAEVRRALAELEPAREGGPR